MHFIYKWREKCRFLTYVAGRGRRDHQEIRRLQTKNAFRHFVSQLNFPLLCHLATKPVLVN